MLAKLKKLTLPKLNIMTADAAFDSVDLRKTSKENDIILLAATNPRRKKNIIIYRPACRWIVERTFGWLQWYRSLKICWAKTEESFLAFFSLAASIQLFRML